MVMVDVDGSCLSADSQSKSVGLVWGLAATLALSLHSSNEPGKLSQWLCHDDSTINIILVIIIIIIMFDPHTKFVVSTITCNEEIKGNTKCKNSRF